MQQSFIKSKKQKCRKMPIVKICLYRAIIKSKNICKWKIEEERATPGLKNIPTCIRKLNKTIYNK